MNFYCGTNKCISACNLHYLEPQTCWERGLIDRDSFRETLATAFKYFITDTVGRTNNMKIYKLQENRIELEKLTRATSA